MADWARGRTALVGDASSCGGGNKAAVAFLCDTLAQGPISAREIERRSVSAGLLEEGKPIGKSKGIRTLGAKSYQQPGQRAGGWIWSWDQAPVPPATQSEPDAGEKRRTGGSSQSGL